MSSVLVSGASGFIGSHLCRELVRQGHQVIGLSHTGKADRVSDLIGKKNFGMRIADITDKQSLDDVFKLSLSLGTRIKTIFHLAALVPYVKGEDVIGVNAIGTRNLINVACTNGVEEFIYASSLSVYSVPPEKLPIPENHPTKSDTAYGMSKVLGEKCCKAMAKSMKTIIVRYAGAFGDGMDSSRVIPSFTRKALKNETIDILGDGENSSDFCHVDDLVNGTILAWQKGKSGEAYNIGSGRETRLLDLASDIIDLAQSKSGINLKLDSKIDRPFRFYLDISKARNELGYSPNPFDQRIREYVASYK